MESVKGFREVLLQGQECIPYDLYLKNLKSCLEDMKNQMIKSGEKYLAMPKIASGLDMCKWEDVKK